MLGGRGIEREKDGSYRVRLPREERALLQALPGELRELIADGALSLRRLFPPAYEHDADANADYTRLVGTSLLESRLGALQVFEETAFAERLDERQLEAWLGALESLRLVLGTELDVTEDAEPLDPDHPEAPRLALYHWLSWLQDEVVQALSGALPAEREAR